MSKRVKRAARAVALSGVALIGVIGLLHTSFARPLLARIGGCPIGKASAAEVDQARVRATRETAGSNLAPARPAAGFTLDVTTIEDVRAWARAHDVTCSDRREGMLWICGDVPARALADRAASGDTLSEIAFAFRPSDRTLVNLRITRFKLTPSVAAAAFDDAAERLARSAGAPQVVAPPNAREDALARLSAGPLTTSTIRYRFSDYQADVTATRMGDRDVIVQEHYVSGK